jgi:hypothetical protein
MVHRATPTKVECARKTAPGRAAFHNRYTANSQLIRDNLHTTPKRHMMTNSLSRRLRIRIIPGRVRILLAIDQNRVITRHSLPGATRTRGTGPQKCSVYSLFRKINVSFNRLDLIALCDGLSIPNSLCHYPPSNRFNKMHGRDALANPRMKKSATPQLEPRASSFVP